LKKKKKKERELKEFKEKEEQERKEKEKREKEEKSKKEEEEKERKEKEEKKARKDKERKEKERKEKEDNDRKIKEEKEKKDKEDKERKEKEEKEKKEKEKKEKEEKDRKAKEEKEKKDKEDKDKKETETPDKAKRTLGISEPPVAAKKNLLAPSTTSTKLTQSKLANSRSSPNLKGLFDTGSEAAPASGNSTGPAPKRGIDALLAWCQKCTELYEGVHITNFQLSWKDGLAFCALVSYHYPKLLDYKVCLTKTPGERLIAAFDAASSVGIPSLLDPEDITDIPVPEKLSIITYLGVLYKGLRSVR